MSARPAARGGGLVASEPREAAGTRGVVGGGGLVASEPREAAGTRPAVFLDRDGVINRDQWPTVLSWSEFQFLPGAVEAIAELTKAGWPVFIATNKTAMGWGLLSKDENERIMHAMLQRIEGAGGVVEAWYHCPHNTLLGPLTGCDCHKPKPGMLLRAAREHGLDLPRSWMVGDTFRDVGAGKAAGCRTILVGEGSARARRRDPDFHVADLAAAARIILQAKTA